MEIVSIEGQARAIGKKATKAVRKEGKVPCNVYGGEKNLNFAVEPLALRSLIYTPAFKVADIKVGDDACKAFIKEIQFHPVTDEILHVDFVELVPGKTVRTEIPVKLVGAAPGVKVGGRLMQNMRKVKIKTTADALVSEITADVSELELGKSIRVRDIKAIEGIQVMNSPATPLATIEIPRALKSAQASAAAAAKG